MKSNPNMENLPPDSLSCHYFSGKNLLGSETPETGSSTRDRSYLAPRPQCKVGPEIVIYVEANACFLAVMKGSSTRDNRSLSIWQVGQLRNVI